MSVLVAVRVQDHPIGSDFRWRAVSRGFGSNIVYEMETQVRKKGQMLLNTVDLKHKLKRKEWPKRIKSFLGGRLMVGRSMSTIARSFVNGFN